MPEPIETFYPESIAEWRAWLQENHLSKQAVWLVCYRIKSGKKSIRWSESVDVALCFGWIDSVPRKVDDERTSLYFSPRKPKSEWSKINKDRIKGLIARGEMAPAGLTAIEVAKQNGSWDTLTQSDLLLIPDDLSAEFAKYRSANANFNAFPPSTQKAILAWIYAAKTDVTRQKRVQLTAELAEQNIRANQWRPKNEL